MKVQHAAFHKAALYTSSDNDHTIVVTMQANKKTIKFALNTEDVQALSQALNQIAEDIETINAGQNPEEATAIPHVFPGNATAIRTISNDIRILLQVQNTPKKPEGVKSWSMTPEDAQKIYAQLADAIIDARKQMQGG